jgi:aryl carrier-like protein
MYVAPQTEREKMLASVWAEVLHLERVGIHDNLFELGADSLHIFQIVARAGKAGLKLAPAGILRHRTISAVLAQVDSEGTGPARPSAPAIVPVSRERYRMRASAPIPEKEIVR